MFYKNKKQAIKLINKFPIKKKIPFAQKSKSLAINMINNNFFHTISLLTRSNVIEMKLFGGKYIVHIIISNGKYSYTKIILINNKQKDNEMSNNIKTLVITSILLNELHRIKRVLILKRPK